MHSTDSALFYCLPLNDADISVLLLFTGSISVYILSGLLGSAHKNVEEKFEA